MRAILLTSLALGTVACSGDAMHLDYRSTLWNETRGVVYSDDGTLGHAAMLDTTCQFDVASGMVTGDVDLPTDAEVVADGADGLVLATSAAGIHRIEGLHWFAGLDVELSGVIDAALAGGEPLALVDRGTSCEVVWTDRDLHVDVGACAADAQLVGAPRSGRAFLASDGIISEVTADGLVDLEFGQHLAFNEGEGTLVFAEGDRVAEIDLDGGLLWERTAAGQVVSLDDMGDLGGVAVTTDTARLELYGADGALRMRSPLPESARVVVSGSGRDLSLVLPEQVNFYGVEDGPQRMTTERPPVENPFSD